MPNGYYAIIFIFLRNQTQIIMEILGIDIGGSGVKGALVNLENGQFSTERHRIETPRPAKKKAIAETINNIVEHFNYQGPVGCGFPGIIHNGVAKSAANMHKSWVDVDAEKLFSDACGQEVFVLNDADAAGIAELEYGAGKGLKGLAILLTIGTGIGSALIKDGILIPNTEFGHLEFKGDIAEKYCSDAARERLDLKWDKWGKRFNQYLLHLERLFSPDLFILGGGASKKFDMYEDELKNKARVITATLKNQAGIIGAAHYASQMSRK